MYIGGFKEKVIEEYIKNPNRFLILTEGMELEFGGDFPKIVKYSKYLGILRFSCAFISKMEREGFIGYIRYELLDRFKTAVEKYRNLED